MTYICDNCGGSFTAPLEKHYDSPEYGPVTDIYCPHCGEELGNLDEYEADECPVCGGDKNKSDLLCPHCRLATRSLLRLQLGCFTADQLAYIDQLWEDHTASEMASGAWKEARSC